MIISKKYLTVCTDSTAPEKQIVANDENGNMIFKLQLRADKRGIPFYLDAEQLMGKSVHFYCDGEEFHFDGETDVIPPPVCKAESFRPELHYTVPYGWLNDPNGLVFYGGKYHLFCQHNPLGTAWGNMHWYHSVTTDFIRFEHLGDALFPDSTGTMFSGSAICDTENVSGLGKNSLLVFYTAAGYSDAPGKSEFSQCLAYSADGVHFTKYKNNPVVPNIKGENRDPKVVYVPELKSFVMALYLEDDEYCLLKSANLTDWVRFQTIHLKGDGECPDLYYIKDSDKWIFSGASDYYLVGHFEECGFVAEQQEHRFYCELDGRLSYAAQSYSGTPDRALRISWENIGPEKAQCFCGQMSIPMEMSLVTLADGQMRLKSHVCKEFEENLSVVCHLHSGRHTIESGAYIADIEFENDAFSICIDNAVLNINPCGNTISYCNKSVPLTLRGKQNLRLIVDRLSIEILADDGLIFSSVRLPCNKITRTLALSGKNVKATLLTVDKKIKHD